MAVLCLTDQHLTALNTIITQCEQARELICSLKECGVVMDEEQQVIDTQHNYAVALRAKFFPMA